MTPRILVADDSATIQKVVELTFSKEDFLIIKALNGVEAIAKAKESKPDIILLDVFMPDKSGYEVCESVRGDPQLTDIPIILLVGAFESFDKERGLRSGANDYVTKPFESKQLIAKVKQLLFARTAKLASERVEKEVEAPKVEAISPPAPAVETPPLRAAVEIPTASPAVTQPPLVLEPEIILVPEAEILEEPSLDLEPEIPTPTAAVPGAGAVPSGEREPGVSDEELWQMLDLSGPEAEPLPSAAKAEEELTVVSEDSAEAFFELYSQVEPPSQIGESKGEVPLAEPFRGEEAMAEGMEKAGAEVISFENLQDAVAEEQIPIPSGEGIPTWEEEVLPPLETEEVSGIKEEAELRTAPAPAISPAISAEGAIPEEMMGSIADRIVKEVTDRLVSRIERIIWEVVPDLAEVLITKEIEKIKAVTEEQEIS